MYIIIEGMPGTGKTALAKHLSKKINGLYVKSICSNTHHGDLLRDAINKNLPQKELDTLYLIDLLLDELKINSCLNDTDVIRDKSYASSLAHIKTHGFSWDSKTLDALYLQGFEQLSKNCIKPDLVVFLYPDKQKILLHCKEKNDTSYWDNYLFSNEKYYITQNDYLFKELSECYEDKLLVIPCFSKDLEGLSNEILNHMKRGNI